MIKTTQSGRSDFDWPPLAIFAVLMGFALALYIGRLPGRAAAMDLFRQVGQLFTWRSQPTSAEIGQVLVITTNPGDQLSVITTLSPRGFHPLLASTEQEVQSQIRAYPGAVKLAVADATLPDYPRIARTLKEILPSAHIIVLKRSHGSPDIGPMLLERLGFLREFN